MSAQYPSWKTKRFYCGWLSQVKAKHWSEEKEFAVSIRAIPHLFERLFLISWENNRDCHVTMSLSLKIMEVQIKGDQWNKRFRTVQVYSSIIVAGPILRVLNKLRKTAVLVHYKMPGGHPTTLYTERLRLEVQPFGIPLLAKTVPLLYSFHWKILSLSLSHTCLINVEKWYGHTVPLFEVLYFN